MRLTPFVFPEYKTGPLGSSPFGPSCLFWPTWPRPPPRGRHRPSNGVDLGGWHSSEVLGVRAGPWDSARSNVLRSYPTRLGPFNQ